MLNYIWAFMVIAGILIALFTGNLAEITNSLMTSSEEAVSLSIRLLGNVCLWAGIIRIAEKAGLIDSLSRKMSPVLRFLFPEIPKDHKSLEHISTNMIANVLGLGYAATPAGIAAMKELQKINKNKKVASVSMCTFMIINMSSLQLITINILAYRAEYGSANPAEIIAPGILATLVSSAVAIMYAKAKGRWS